MQEKKVTQSMWDLINAASEDEDEDEGDHSINNEIKN